MISSSRRTTFLIGLALVLGLGMALRTVQYLGEVSLWHDEAAIGLNLDERGFVGLVSEPLDFAQMAPAGWLALLEAASRLPGSIELRLRLVPFLVSVLGLVLFWRVGRRFLDGSALLGAILLFAVAPAMIWYSASVKQYGADLTATIALVWLALRYRDHPDDPRRAAAAGIGGALAVLVSFPAIVVAFLLGTVLLVRELRELGRPSPGLMLLGGGWGLGAAAGGLGVLRLTSAETREYMESFWAHRFLPRENPLGALLSVPERIFSVFGHFLIHVEPANVVLATIVALPLLFAGVGAVVLWRDRETRGLLLLVPTLTGVLLDIVHVLPMSGRLALYTGWPLVVVAFVGIQRILERNRNRRWLHALSFVPAAPLLLAVVLVATPPMQGQSTRPFLEDLADWRSPSEPLYVTCGGRLALAFYGPRVGLDSWHQGTCDYPRIPHLRPEGLSDEELYSPLYAEIERYRGEPRLWLFYTQSLGEAQALRERLEEWGTLVQEWDNGGQRGAATGVILFDLSD